MGNCTNPPPALERKRKFRKIEETIQKANRAKSTAPPTNGHMQTWCRGEF